MTAGRVTVFGATRMSACALLVLLLSSVAAVSADTTLSGELRLPVMLLPSGDPAGAQYVSALNPDNIIGFSPVSFSPRLRLELLSFSSGADMEVVLGLSEAVAASAPDVGAPAGAYPPVALELLTANARLYLGDRASIRVGRVVPGTGFGFGWNPVDLLSNPVSALDPATEERGLDVLSVALAPFYELELTGYAVYRPGPSSAGLQWDDLRFAADATVYLPGFEFMLTGLYEHDIEQGEDGYAPAVAAAFKADLFGVGLYAEGLVLKASRHLTPTAAMEFSRPEEVTVNALVGLEYHFAGGLSVVSEYFYNGEGYTPSERGWYEDYITNVGGFTPEIASLFVPGSFAQHYALLSAAYTLGRPSADFEAAGIYSPDSSALMMGGGVAFYLTDNFSVEGTYAGLYTLADARANDATLSPVSHMVTVEGVFVF